MLSRFISLVAVAAYLMAAFLPCEPPVGFVEPSTGAHPGHRAESMPQSAAARSMHAEHSHHRASPDFATARSSRDTSSLQAGLELKAKCLCGCDETRAMVGGGAARLGSVVAGSEVARLLEAEKVVPEDLWRAPLVETFLHGEPLPT